MKYTCLVITISIALFAGCTVNRIPEEYRDIAVPHERLASYEARDIGSDLYSTHCATCHGAKADGYGERTDLDPSPADLTDPMWRDATSPLWIFYVIREGKRHTAMLGLKQILTEEETWDLVAFVVQEGYKE